MKINPKGTMAAAVLFTLMIPMMASAVVKTTQVSEDKIVLSYHAVEMDTALGRKYLEIQIRNAARKVCGFESYSKVRSVGRYMKSKTCYRDSVSSAMGRLETRSVTTD